MFSVQLTYFSHIMGHKVSKPFKTWYMIKQKVFYKINEAFVCRIVIKQWSVHNVLSILHVPEKVGPKVCCALLLIILFSGFYFEMIKIPQILVTGCQNLFTWWDSLVILTSNVNFDAGLILQIFAITLCAVNQLLNRKITKIGSAFQLMFQVITGNYNMKNDFCLLVMTS